MKLCTKNKTAIVLIYHTILFLHNTQLSNWIFMKFYKHSSTDKSFIYTDIPIKAAVWTVCYIVTCPIKSQDVCHFSLGLHNWKLLTPH